MSAPSIRRAVLPVQVVRCPDRRWPTMAFDTPAFAPRETFVSPRNSMYCRRASRLMSFTQSLLSILSERIREPNALLVTSQPYPQIDTCARVIGRSHPACQRTTGLLFVSAPDTVLLAERPPMHRESVSVTELSYDQWVDRRFGRVPFPVTLQRRRKPPPTIRSGAAHCGVGRSRS